MANLPINVTTQSGMDIAQAEDYLGISRKSIRNKVASGDLRRKVNGKKYIYDTNDVVNLKNYIDSELVESQEVMDTFRDNGLCDGFKYFGGKGKEKKRCKYNRLLDEFPISPKQLLNHGYIEADNEIKPVRYKKKSIASGLVKLKSKVK